MTSADDILAVLAELGHKPDPEARTTAELVEAWGRGERWVRVTIRKLAAIGCVRTTSRIVSRIDGQSAIVPAYVIEIPKPKKAKK
jgi:hypothetical protein